MIKKIIDKIDFLWVGDSDTLLIMWSSILLAIGTLAELAVNVYFSYNE